MCTYTWVHKKRRHTLIQRHTLDMKLQSGKGQKPNFSWVINLVSYLGVEKQSTKELSGLVQASFQIHSTWTKQNKKKKNKKLRMNEDKINIQTLIWKSVKTVWSIDWKLRWILSITCEIVNQCPTSNHTNLKQLWKAWHSTSALLV